MEGTDPHGGRRLGVFCGNAIGQFAGGLVGKSQDKNLLRVDGVVLSGELAGHERIVHAGEIGGVVHIGL
jgi:hypothetical protein